ncbi:hypothetical protein LTR70_004385 [Exophiala xenobiotica]|uniref:Rab-GAP TBC domain-containing protein n=1 Tax=Lithohypha guttulata TaxID=1690604 RepID=A0ABR0KJD7_9EURO|nr:hypothetical protein LTR24_001962 [Lithohypha guttulata]KAK5320975.1 hypothetical protein LTR70_004385 [Exophiala xenobiotica]
MRQLQDIEKRWSILFNTSIAVDLRQATRDDGDFDPCEDGLRSVCWKSFLLTGPLSKASWSRKLKDQRSGYASLRDHFLKYIDNPNDLHSSADPLADDETSPWATFRQDEISREEIWQDVIRCNIDNYFFTEPSTQRKLLDILFIYSKLNPDTGYRQGMHEILAPVLWVVYQDSIDVKSISEGKKDEEGVDFMLDVLDSRHVEADAFNLFCAIMQTCKTFYETAEGRDSSPIVAQSERIHKELLGAVDPDLSVHLEVVGVVPEIFAIRWLRLLFGRELGFKDVLKLWDILFAESLNVDIIDMSCVAILLRLRWQLIDADYTTAITTLTRLNLPKEGDSARAIVKDALQLARRQTPEAGADITQLRTGRRQYINPLAEDAVVRVPTPEPRTHRRIKSQASPSPSPARFTTPQRHLESLFNNVSNNFQKNAEGWSVQNVSKALKGAVGEARKNFEHIQTGHSRSSSTDIQRSTLQNDAIAGSVDTNFKEQVMRLEERNKVLAKMLENAQETLRKWKSQDSHEEDVFNTALAKIQFVSVYLTDADIPIPTVTPTVEQVSDEAAVRTGGTNDEANEARASDESDAPHTSQHKTSQSHGAEVSPTPSKADATTQALRVPTASPMPRASSPSPTRPAPTRPSLAESSFSFMLGENRHRSSFVRSTPLPEERRSSDAQREKSRKNSIDSKSKQKPGIKDKKDRKAKGGRKDSDDGFTMSTLQ